jgi:recombinational DNA repair protein (RecF pathway)
MKRHEGYVLNRFYLVEAEESDALTKIVQVYLKQGGLITLYVRDIYVDSNIFGKLELFDKVELWWESVKDLANLVDIVNHQRNKRLYNYENFMGFSYISKLIKDDIKLYDEYIYKLLEFFWDYHFGKNFYLPVLWFLVHISDYLGIRPMFLDMPK